MNPNPLAILVVIAISAAVFGGIVFFGLRNPAPPQTGGPVIAGTTVRIPDILNLPGFGGARTPQTPGVEPGGEKISETTRPDVVVETQELPSPILPPSPGPSPLASARNQILPSPQPQTFLPAPTPQPQPLTNATTTPPIATPPISSFQLGRRPTPSQAAAIASFSVFDVSPQLRDFRTQMVKEGVIKNTEFVKINNNTDMERFLLKLVEWQAQKASSTPEQIQDALDRIRKAYARIK